jgi:hypothetical protein
MTVSRPVRTVLAALAVAVSAGPALAQSASHPKTYEVEWVYRVKYGFQDEWWRIFQKYQIAILDREKQLGYVVNYTVTRPGLHVSEDSRWDYRVVIDYPDQDGAAHEEEVTRALFPDAAARKTEENRRWELTLNHWDLPIHQIDPHQPPE